MSSISLSSSSFGTDEPKQPAAAAAAAKGLNQFHPSTSPEAKDAADLWDLSVDTKYRLISEYEKKIDSDATKITKEEDTDDTYDIKDESVRIVGEGTDDGRSITFNDEVYRTGDFVYVEPADRFVERRVVVVERLWTNGVSGEKMIHGTPFYRPSETHHSASRKFFDKELFKSDTKVDVPLSKVAGRCSILAVKDYFNTQPSEGYPNKDVYVSESSYSRKALSFGKLLLSE